MSKEVKRYYVQLWRMEEAKFAPGPLGASEMVKASDYEALLAERDNYKAWYDDALDASNIAGFAGMSAAQVISHQSEENAQLLAERDRLKEALNALRAATPSLACESFHHARRDQHDHDEECPPFERWIAAALACNAALQGEQP